MENQKSKSSLVVKLIIILAILTILLVNIFCTLAICCPNVLEIIFPGYSMPASTNSITMTDAEKVESTLLANGLSIIGIAVAVWSGLNIANAIERREFDNLRKKVNWLDKKVYETVQNLDTQVSDVERQQNHADKAKLLNEMYYTARDCSTKVLIEKIREVKVTDECNFLALMEIERIFNSVYSLHKSEYSYDTGLLQEAKLGIDLANKLLTGTKNPTIKLYLIYRIAEFNYYSGYCCDQTERELYFGSAIKIYIKVVEQLGGYLPSYEDSQVYPDITYKVCKSEAREISAYICNSIGDAYSKIVQAKEYVPCTKKQITEYGLKAIFYCAYAVHWHNKETYVRNLGCALERYHGFSNKWYREISDIYRTALELPGNNINSYKTLVSIYDKHINEYMKIGSVDIKRGRTPSLNDHFYINNWNEMANNAKEEVLKTLEDLLMRAEQAKTIYPSKDVGYIYSCIYHRDMCIISNNNSVTKKSHLETAKQNLEILEVINHNGALTEILRQDLNALECK